MSRKPSKKLGPAFLKVGVSNPGPGPLSCIVWMFLCSNTPELSEWMIKSAELEEVIQSLVVDLVSWTREQVEHAGWWPQD